MKKKTTLLFGVLASLLVVSLALPFGYAGLEMNYQTLTIKSPPSACCEIEQVTPVCWADNPDDCEYCCDLGNQYEFINDRAGCGCCVMPGGQP